MKDLNAERLTLNFSRLRCWDTHRKMFQIVEKWFILSWSHLIVNSHIHFSTIWNVSDCRKMVYIELITPHNEWSHIHFSTTWNISDCRKMVCFEMITPYSEWSQPFFYISDCRKMVNIELITPQSEWSHPFFYNLKHIHFSTIWNDWKNISWLKIFQDLKIFHNCTDATKKCDRQTKVGDF